MIDLLFGSTAGVMSLIVMVVMIGIGAYLGWMFLKRSRED